MGTDLINLLVAVFALVLAAYFAFLETAFTSLRLYQVKELEDTLGKYSHFFSLWKMAPQKILTVILVTHNFFNILCSVLVTRVLEANLGEMGLAIGVSLATLVVLLFSDIIPKTWAKIQHDPLFRLSLGVLNWLVRIMAPLANFLLVVAFWFLKCFGITVPTKAAEDVSEAEIKFLIGYGDEAGIIEAEKSEMLQNIFGLGAMAVSKIMVPKEDMVLCDVDRGIANARDLLLTHRFSRLPLYRGREDNIIGMVYYKDLFSTEESTAPKSLCDMMRPIMFMPESKKVNQLLQDFLKKRLHMGIVVDEYGAVSGLVTLEDVLEEIVGEIRDEHERETPSIVPLDENNWLISAGVSLENVTELLKIKFATEKAETLGGFLMEQLQQLPKAGDKVVYQGYEFIIHEATRRRVSLVKVHKV